MKRLDLNLLQSLDALLSTRSVSRAAERMGVGQPAMSASLARARALFGDPLLVRGADGFERTSRAEELRVPLAAALGELRGIVENKPAFDPATSTRTFRLAGGDYAGLVLMPRLLALLEREAPAVRLRLRFLEKDRIVPCLDDGSVDLALVVLPDVPPRIRSAVLFEEEFVCAARRDHPLMAGPLTPERFAAERHLLLTERPDDTGAVDDALARMGLHRQVVATMPLVSLVLQTLASTNMVATIGRRAASDAHGARGIAWRPLPFAMPRWRMQALIAERRNADAGLGWLHDRLKAVANG